MKLDVLLAARFGLLSIQLDRLKASHAIVEGALRQHDAGVDEWLVENLKRDPNDREFIEYLHGEQKADATEGYPQVLRTALFTAAYGVLELFMTALCRQLEQKVSGPRLKELRGEGIRRAQLFIAKVADAKFPDTSEWQTLLLYGVLRNAVVHAQGDLAGHQDLQAIKQLQSRVKTFVLSLDGSSVVLQENFVPQFLALVETFAEQLDEAVRHHIFTT